MVCIETLGKSMRMSFTPLKVVCAVSALFFGLPLFSAQAAVITDFGTYMQSSDWNALILGDVTDYSNSGVNQTDIEGSVAIKGNLQGTGGAIPSLTIGAKLATRPGFDASQTTLVVGGNLANRNNTIFGSTWVGGNADIGGGPEFGGGFSVTGNLTVGGDLTFNASNSGGQIGQALGGAATTRVGGTTELGQGSNVFGTVQGNDTVIVHGDGMGDTLAIITQNGGVLTDIAPPAGSFRHDHYDAGGDFDPYLNARAITGVPTALPSSPIDFGAMTSGLEQDSADMALLSANASWAVDDGSRLGTLAADGTITVVPGAAGSRTGTILDAAGSSAAPGEAIVFNLNTNPFDVTLSFDPSDIWKNGWFIDADEDASIIINVSGATHSITDFLFEYSPVLSYENVVFNFFDATEIFLGMADNSSGIGFKGNILAPLAHVFFYNGLLEGNLVAAGLTGNGQINWMRGGGQGVPEPGILWLLVLGGLSILMLGQWQRLASQG